jgi:hypothetical protein
MSPAAAKEIGMAAGEVLGELPDAYLKTMGQGWSRIMAAAFGGKLRSATEKALKRGLLGAPNENMTWGQVRLEVYWRHVVYKEGKSWYVMGSDDLNRVRRTVACIRSGIRACVAESLAKPTGSMRKSRAKDTADAFWGWFSVAVKHMNSSELGKEHTTVQMLRKVVAVAYAKMAGPLCAAKRGRLRALALEIPGCTEDIVDDLLGMLPRNATCYLNVTKVHNVFAEPDTSPSATLCARAKAVHNTNDFDPEFEREFRLALEDQILRALIRTRYGEGLALRNPAQPPAWYPHYLAGRMDQVPSAEISQHLMWEGSCPLRKRGDIDPGSWKDSSIPLDLEADALAPDARTSPKLANLHNQILRLVFDEDCPMPSKGKTVGPSVTELLPKPEENHKVPKRATFSQDIGTRHGTSAGEELVGEVCKGHPSYSIGTGATAQRMRDIAITKTPDNPGHVVLYMSYDVKGWSERMSRRAQEISRAVWGDLTGDYKFRRGLSTMHDSFVFLNMMGYCGWYINTGSNMEGINGKEMTMLNVALADLSIREFRRRMVDQGHLTQAQANQVVATVLAYIDDGLARIEVPHGVAGIALEVLEQCFVDVFARGSFTVVPMKSFPSDAWAIFLNEVYFSGRKVAQGARSAIGLSAQEYERHLTLEQRVMAIYGTVRGAVVGGMAAVAGTFLLAYELYDKLMAFTKLRNPTALVAYAYSPTSWGGLGAPTMLQLSTNGSGASYEESLHTMNKFSALSVHVKRYYLKRLRRGLRPRGPRAVVSAPLGGALVGARRPPVLVPAAVRRALIGMDDNGVLSKLASEVLSFGNDRYYNDYCQRLLDPDFTPVIQEATVVEVRESHPYVIYQKFMAMLEKGTTIRRVVGFRAYRKILGENAVHLWRNMADFMGDFFQ